MELLGLYHVLDIDKIDHAALCAAFTQGPFVLRFSTLLTERVAAIQGTAAARAGSDLIVLLLTHD